MMSREGPEEGVCERLTQVDDNMLQLTPKSRNGNIAKKISKEEHLTIKSNGLLSPAYATTNPNHNPNPTKFSMLPIELRLAIWSLALCFPQVVPMTVEQASDGEDHLTQVIPNGRTNMLRVSKEVRWLAKVVLHSTNAGSPNVLVNFLVDTIWYMGCENYHQPAQSYHASSWNAAQAVGNTSYGI
jgi:hypothetical protein